MVQVCGTHADIFWDVRTRPSEQADHAVEYLGDGVVICEADFPLRGLAEARWVTIRA